MFVFVSLFLGTFVSEDLTCITGGILAEKGQVNLLLVISACTLGIFISDLWLFIMGKFFLNLSKNWERFSKILNSHLVLKIKNQVESNFGKLVLLSRFTPGTRLPVYFLSGTLGTSFVHFSLYSFIACSIWTPVLVVLSYFYGKAILQKFNDPYSYSAIVFTAVSFFIIFSLIAKLSQNQTRREIWIKLQKIPKLEFWPIWIFYIPVIPYIALLMLRYKGFLTITCSNPGIENGGMAGESKSKILTQLPQEWIARFILIEPGSKVTEEAILLDGFQFPLILKPDVGERGAFVQKVQNYQELISILANVNVPTILQEFHPGPFEIGVFYYRYPRSAKGSIFSITNKIFPELICDGKSTIEELIYQHPRYKFQATTFIENNLLQLNEIPPTGEIRRIGILGNHIQGCLFKDGSHLITRELEERIDEISKHFTGFNFGRYDLRYTNEDELKLGTNFQIIELNGAMSESTNLYDPDFTIFQAYSYLFAQWKHLFQIGYENRKLGAVPITYWELYNTLKRHFQYKEELLKKAG
ncbi:MAG: VTT domain-containing protein [Leptospiraceae bacterium]|nr:VTT domain-containing protein [Leptospiraceae bacterium]